jgi:hypothetical protein
MELTGLAYLSLLARHAAAHLIVPLSQSGVNRPRALRTNPSIEITGGPFLTKRTYLPEVAEVDRIAALQRAGTYTRGIRPAMAHVYHSEEKGTDVNLAVDLMHDAHLERFDAAAA